ncbi:hypothetical protein JTB14_000998 [Gonioctena quinquepunctata]|nr:hypothetical protein JTB14_000998 [Gonioctena quinquepunctata]
MICPKCCVGAHEAEDLGEETENDNNAIGNTYMHADHYSYNAEDEALLILFCERFSRVPNNIFEMKERYPFERKVVQYETTWENVFRKEEDELLNSSIPSNVISLVIIIFMWALSLMANCLMIQAFRKSKTLDSWENNIVRHWCWMNLLFLIFQPAINMIFLKTPGTGPIACFLADFPNSLLVTSMVFALTIILSYFFLHCKYSCFLKLRNWFEANSIFTVYVCGTILYVVTFLSCHFRKMRFTVITYSIDAIMCMAIVLNIMRYFLVSTSERTRSTKHLIYMGNAAIFMNLPLLIVVHIFATPNHDETQDTFSEDSRHISTSPKNILKRVFGSRRFEVDEAMAERLNINPLTMAVNETGTDDIESILVVLNYFTILTNTIKLIICLCVVPVDIFLITTISKSKKLQTKTNEYIKHYSIFNLIYMVASPLLWFILELGALTRYLGINIYCMILQVDASSILFCQLFAFGLALEWLLKSRNSKERLGKIREYLVRIIYVGGFLGFITHNILCFTHYWRVSELFDKLFVTVCEFFISQLENRINMADIFNETVDSDPLGDTSAAEYEQEVYDNVFEVFSYLNLAATTVQLLLFICVLAADIFLITIICKKKRLRTKINSYIMHFLIFDMIAILSMPVLRIFMEVTSMWKHIGYRTYCISAQVETSSIMFCHLFSFGLVLEWFLTIHNPELGRKFMRFYKYSISIIYAIGTSQLLILTGLCFREDWTVRHLTESLFFFYVCIFLCICDFFSYKKKNQLDNKNSYALTIANVMILSWLPLYLYHELLLVIDGTIISLILYSTIFIPECLAYGCPIIMVVMLGKLNKYFQMAYDRAFKKSARNYGDDDDNLDESEDVNIVNTVNVHDNASVL